MERDGFPAYTTSAGWLGYTEEEIRRLAREAVAEGWNDVKMKVGGPPEEDASRAAIIREEIGMERRLMMDANQVWDVPEAIEKTLALQGVRAVLDGGADQPRRRPRPRRDRRRRSRRSRSPPASTA